LRLRRFSSFLLVVANLQLTKLDELARQLTPFWTWKELLAAMIFQGYRVELERSDARQVEFGAELEQRGFQVSWVTR
jgi:hypothetical protein